MKVYRAYELDLKGVRAHPWITALADPKHRYCDFKARPDLIATSLEDFTPWSRHAAVRTFYDMLRWLNGPDSELETDDCAFGGIRRSSKSELADVKQADGRLMLFYRQLPFNCDQRAEWLMDCFDFHLGRLNTEIDLGVVGLSKAETYFKSILQTGRSLILNFWAWGNTPK
jgi:hypothetical protein